MAGVVGYDLLQRERAILRNFPVIGHLRYLLEAFGPELRQYIVTSNNEEHPFSRDQRRWIWASAEGKPNVFGFGTDDEMESVESLLIIKHSPFPAAAPAQGDAGGPPLFEAPVGKVLGAAHGRRHAFRPRSIVNVSGMSYGALSPVAVEALNRGAMLAGVLHNTGEGGLSRLIGTALSWSSRSGPATSGVATTARASASRSCVRESRRHLSVRSRSSSPRARSLGSAGCSPAPR